jgi:hypothetical protein
LSSLKAVRANLFSKEFDASIQPKSSIAVINWAKSKNFLAALPVTSAKSLSKSINDGLGGD